MKLSDYRGKVAVVYFWATWCGFCMDCIPEANELVQKYSDRPFVFLGVNSDATIARAKETVAEKDIKWPSWFDGKYRGKISTLYHIEYWPRVFVIDPDGVIEYTGGGIDDRAKAAIRQLLFKMQATAKK